jgi:hypothetical protein
LKKAPGEMMHLDHHLDQKWKIRWIYQVKVNVKAFGEMLMMMKKMMKMRYELP